MADAADYQLSFQGILAAVYRIASGGDRSVHDTDIFDSINEWQKMFFFSICEVQRAEFRLRGMVFCELLGVLRALVVMW